MELPEPLRFDPVPLRSRHNGWSADDQRAFILKLSRGHLVDEACRALRHSRQSAYALRRRDGARSFARAWDRAMVMGRVAMRARARLPSPDLSWALETLLVPKFYRGRLVGFVQRHDDRNAIRLLAECDRLEEEWNLSKLTR
jgi:hypothetical protein